MTLQIVLGKSWRVMVCLVFLLSNLTAVAYAEHRDPAPIPDEVLQKLLPVQQGAASPLIVALSRHLDEAVELIRQVEHDNGRLNDPGLLAARLSAKHMQLAGKRSELGTLRTEVHAQFAAVRERLASLGLIDKVKEWDALLARVEERFERVGRVLASVENAPDKIARGKALAKARRELHDLHGKVKEKEMYLGDAPLPTWKQDNRPFQRPDYDHAAPPAFLISQPRTLNNLYAFNGNTLLAALPDPTPIEAQSCGFNAADLGESQEVKLTPEIKALAEQLGYSPARIYEYVANEIKYEPYYGSLKGATGTLVAKAGNATDQASLLIALLRASNIPARYVKGITNFVNEARLMRWLGAKTQVAAANILSNGGIPTYFDSATGTVQFTHVWAEACVPYAHYRGARFDNAGNR